MTSPQTCRSCGETKPIQAYERLRSGGYRGTCIACRQAANAARKRERAQARPDDPEYWAKLEQRERAREEREAQARTERMEREAALRDDIWSAMRRGRSRRSLEAAQPGPTRLHRLALREGGYISAAELACRCAEREAASRAAASCKTFEAAAAASSILEQATPTLERHGQVRQLWRHKVPSDTFAALKAAMGDLEDAEEIDPLADAFGEWAPPWMGELRAAKSGHETAQKSEGA